LQVLGLQPGRAWIVSVGRLLTVADPEQPRRSYKWYNHVAPTLVVEEAEASVRIIDPSLARAGPVTLAEWAGCMNVRLFEVSDVGLSQTEILGRQAARTLQGRELDAVIFNLPLGEPPIPEKGGSGFRIDADPPEGVSIYAHRLMQRILELRGRRRRNQP
jgi:hypothetical protein